jgi:hypothetical protein
MECRRSLTNHFKREAVLLLASSGEPLTQFLPPESRSKCHASPGMLNAFACRTAGEHG